MNRLRFRAFAAAAIALLLASDGAAQEITVAPVLKAGDAFQLEVTRTRENSSRPAQNTRTVTPVDVRVVAAGANGYVLEWVPREGRIEGGQPMQDPLVRAAVKATGSMVLRVALNAEGEYTGLENQADVLSQVQKGTEVIVRGVMESLPEAQRTGAEKLLAQVLSPAVLVGSATRDVQTYFSLNGIALQQGKPLTVSLEQPGPLGAAIPAQYRVAIESVDPGTAVLASSTTYDGDALSRSTRSMLEQQGGKPIPEAEFAQLQMQMGDDGRFVLDRSLGLMREVVVNRRVTSGKEQRLDRWEIRLVRAPQR